MINIGFGHSTCSLSEGEFEAANATAVFSAAMASVVEQTCIKPTRLVLLRNGEIFARFSDRTSVHIDANAWSLAYRQADGSCSQHICAFALKTMLTKMRCALAFRNICMDTLSGAFGLSQADKRAQSPFKEVRFAASVDSTLVRARDGSLCITSLDGRVSLTLSSHRRVVEAQFPVAPGIPGAVQCADGWYLTQIFPLLHCPGRWQHPLSLLLYAFDHPDTVNQSLGSSSSSATVTLPELLASSVASYSLSAGDAARMHSIDTALPLNSQV